MGFLTTALGPSPGLFAAGAVLVNQLGERFCDELQNPSAEVPQQPSNVAYIVMDARIANQFEAWPNYISTAPGIAYAYLGDYRRSRRDIYHQSQTVAGLAASMGVAPESLQRAVSGTEGARASDLPALTTPPYVALGPVRSYVVFTDGGLEVSGQLEVVRAGGEVIPGLFAAGSTGQGGLLLEGHGHHLGWAFISGRIAGRNAALAFRADA